MEMILKII